MSQLQTVLLCLLLFGATAATKAQKTVTGKVTDGNDGLPLATVSVTVKGSNVGVISGADGSYSIGLPEDADVLIFSFVGYSTVEESVGERTAVNIAMREEATSLDAVVVTGYGNITRTAFTGSASTISTSRLENLPSISLESKLAGAAAGVKLGISSGQPGATESVRIRGAGSIAASNEPLYVIDGVPMITGNASVFTYSETGNSLLSTINSNDIESITIIKDAGAASLYGSRAANGVIVITTKSGTSSRSSVNFRADFGFSNMAVNYRPTLGGDERRAILYAGLVNFMTEQNAAQTDPSSIEDPAEYASQKINLYAEKPWSGWANWRDLILRTGKQNNYEVNVQGSNDRTNFYSSLAYSKIEGISLQSKLDRITGRVNLNHRINSRLSFGMNATYANTRQQVNSEGTSYSSPVMSISMTASPQDYPRNEDGTFNTTRKFLAMNNPLANPLFASTVNFDESLINRFLGAANLRYDICGGLYARQTVSYDFSQTNNRVWWDPTSNDGTTARGVYQRYMFNRNNLISQTHLGYSRTFGKLHDIDLLAGYETEQYRQDYTYASGSDYPNPNKPEIENASTTRSSSHYDERRLVSFLGVLNYSFDRKYYLSANLRRDGSSKFSKDRRWGDFWSVSGSWRISQEPFARSLSRILSEAKIRLSYGANGNLPVNNYDYMLVYAYGYKYNGTQGAAEARIPDNNLTWEKNYSFNLGIDLSFISRINLVVDLYNRNTIDLLVPKSTSQTTGFISMTTNLGEINNRGIEVSVESKNIVAGDFFWSTSFNLAHNKNTLMKLDGVQSEMAGSHARVRHVVGQPFSSLYGFEYAGVDPATGRESFYRNTPGHERETTTDQSEARAVLIGKVDPTVQGGLTNNLSWFGFDLGFTFTYSFGGHIYDGASGWIGSGGGSMNYNGNVPSYWNISDTWQKAGDNAKLPQFVFGRSTQPSSRWVMSTNHVRLKNITLGYTLPVKPLKAAGISRARVYVSAVNLLTFKPSGMYLDPEPPVDPGSSAVRYYGVATYQTPPLRTVTFGIDLAF
jgi:TonB-linked SusC/RagA family outer membrane protein